MPKLRYRGLEEWEYLCVFETISSEACITPNPDEVEEGMFVKNQHLKDMIFKKSVPLTPDLVLAFKKYSKLST
jgi:isopentenyldiphosphate isomerase